SSILTPPSLSSSCIQYMLPSPMMPKMWVTPSATKSAASLWYTFITPLLYPCDDRLLMRDESLSPYFVSRISHLDVLRIPHLVPRPRSVLRSRLGAARGEPLREFARHALDHQRGAGLHHPGEPAGNLDLRVDGNDRRARCLPRHDLEGHRRFHPRAALVVPAARGDVPDHRCAIQLQRDLRAQSHLGRAELP